MWKAILNAILLLLLIASPASALDSPWIGDVFFYWYTWDYDTELGSWLGGIHNTPLDGYYDSRSFRDNRRSLWQASEWGCTHHFMDYWSPHWKGEDGQMREATVMRAAESLREDGYDIWMSYYQDGENFEMTEFSRNVSERRDVHQWLRDFAHSPVWPKIDGQPLQLVYARNGRPKTTQDNPGFRQFLKNRYGRIAQLNRVWQTDFAGYDDIEMVFTAAGHHRAETIEYQYAIWQREWRKLNGLVKEEFGFPGMRASFDVGYGPYENFGFADFARVFGGPHSYAGIFGQPHDQDAQRFIQAAIAKKYDTVFFDHFKNFYFDWDIRNPGMAYPPDPFHFDRFRVGALARYSEALLHLSWNEWWEGSNLEPCREFGKTYCEKNLFYSTLMKLAFDSIRTAGQDAPVGLLLNDWRLASGGPNLDELYRTVQILRRLNVPFDLVPDEMVTVEKLDQFQLVIAPTSGCGLGYNRNRQPILEVLSEWLQESERRLIISHHGSLAEKFGISEAEFVKAESTTRGEDLNLLVDVGAEGDDDFLRSGYSNRETGMRFGDDGSFRWTPGRGSRTSLILPASPDRDHVLRLRGSAIWPNSVSVLINGRSIATVDFPAGGVEVEAQVPAAAIGVSPMISLELRFALANVPGKKAPERYQGEARVCNLSLNQFQWATANVSADHREQRYTMTEDSLELAGPLGNTADTTISLRYLPRPHLVAADATVLSKLAIGNVSRDLAVRIGRSRVLYVNGSLSEVEAEAYWLPLIERWAGVDFHQYAAGKGCMSGRLYAGDTEFIACFNEDITQPRKLRLSIPAKDVPLSEAVVLARDGRAYQPLPVSHHGVDYLASDSLDYYGVYQFAFSPVKIKTPNLVVEVGRRGTFDVEVSNLTEQAVSGTIGAASIIPTISAPPVPVELEPRETKTVSLPIDVAATADWGTKTVYFNLAFDGRKAVVLRELIVQKQAEVELAEMVVDAKSPRIELRVPENPYGQTAPFKGGRISLGGQTAELPEIEEGGTASVTLPPLDIAASPEPGMIAEKLRIDATKSGVEKSVEHDVLVAVQPKPVAGPPGSLAAIVVYNGRPRPLENEILQAKIPDELSVGAVRSQDGSDVPSSIDEAGRLEFLATVPARSARTFHACKQEAEIATDLSLEIADLGSGKGTLLVENSRISVRLSEAAGGTVTSLRSARTGRDYARNSLGINYGKFSRYDPTDLPTNTVKYIQEEKVHQADSPGRIELISDGPLKVIARVVWSDDRVRVEQTYEFPAFQPYFILRQKVEPIDLQSAQELVAIDAAFKPHGLTKSYPNFVGVVNEMEQPHFGWREGTWVPDYATLMTPNQFEESISLVIAGSRGLTGIRQGFWPEKRPQPGKCQIARMEFLADTATGCETEVYVLIHPGHQIAAKRFLADLRVPPKISVRGWSPDRPQGFGSGNADGR